MFKEEMGDTLDPNGSSESSSKCNTKLYIIIGVAIAIVVVAVVVIVVVVTKGGDEDSKEMKVNLSSIPLPSGVIIDDGHYLFDGNIFITIIEPTQIINILESFLMTEKTLKNYMGMYLLFQS